MPNPFTEEHQLFRTQVRAFAEKELGPHVDEWERDELFPNWVFKKAGELGILGAHYPEEVGGGGGDYWFSVVKSEELPRCGAAGVVMGLLVQSDMATPCINDLGTKEQKEEFLRPALAGDRIAALGVTEPAAGSDVAGIKTTAKKVGDDYVINGSKTYITNGTRADFVTLLVKTQPDAGYGGISIFLLPTDTKGYSVSKKLKKVGNWSSDTAELFLDNCKVPARYLLGQEGQGFYYLMHNFQGERLVAALAGTAAGQRMIEDAIQYGGERKAFGKPILKFQVWQHEFAQLLTEVEAGRRLAYFATDLYDRKIPAVKEISMAKLYCADLINKVADRCLQFHGGYGYMDEYPISRGWRDARLLSIGGGTSEVMREIISKIAL